MSKKQTDSFERLAKEYLSKCKCCDECFAESFYIDDNGLNATLSIGRKTQGKVFFEIPQGAENIELEYSVSVFNDKKIIFNAK